MDLARLPLPLRYRSLRAYAVVWVVIPLSLAIAGLIATGIFAYQRAATHLLVEQQRQLASVTASGVSEILAGYAHLLEAAAAHPDIQRAAQSNQSVAVEYIGTLKFFDRGLYFADLHGTTRLIQSQGIETTTPYLNGLNLVRQTPTQEKPVFTILPGEQPPQTLVVAVPMVTDAGEHTAILYGLVFMPDSSIAKAVKELVIDQPGHAFLFDETGKVIFPVQLTEVDLSDIPSLPDQPIHARSSGRVWRSPEGEQTIEGYAAVGETGWLLVVRQPLEAIVNQISSFRNSVIAAGFLAILALAFLTWQSVRRIVAPIQLLAEQANQLTRVDQLERVAESGIAEVDTLERAFENMASQIASYRAGLRRYVGAITQSQEEERRRIARELHDETIQSLLAISRRLELYQNSEEDPSRKEKLVELQAVVAETLSGIRQINRDLRPLMLEDLGLEPALQALVSGLRKGEGAVPQASLEFSREPLLLSQEQELAIYRITQEALNNIRKHAHATGARVNIGFHDGMVELEIQDDGRGFTPPSNLAELAQQGCFGLMGIQERVWSVGGGLSIESAPGKGTRLKVSMPAHNPLIKAGQER